MNARFHMKLDETDVDRRMYCPNPQCTGTKFKFVLTELEAIDVEVVSVVSTIAMIHLPNGGRREFRKGFVESLRCPTCGTEFHPEDANTDT